MNFELRNFGKIYEADVKLDGITVICGNNDTGKSTVGKALFSFYNSLYDYKARIIENKTYEIMSFISRHETIWVKNADGTFSFKKSANGVKDIAKKVYEFIELCENSCSVEEVGNFLEMQFEVKAPADRTERLLNYLNMPEDKILSELVYRYFDMIMNKEVTRKGKETIVEECIVKAEIKSKIFELKFTDQKWNYSFDEPIDHKAYYINSPYVLDYLNNRIVDISKLPMLERNAIEAIMQAEAKLNADSMSNILDAVSNKDDIEEVKKVLKQAYKGETRIVNGLYVYEDENGIPFDFRNISAGLKAFALIERLLKGGVLKKKDVLILDEPEIHLHSEWQIYYAELIVALQKKFDLTILLVTHSFQFLESLNFFMKTYGISDRGNYYIPEKTKNGYVLRSDDENLKKIKHNLSTGTFHIADLEFEYDMEHDNG